MLSSFCCVWVSLYVSVGNVTLGRRLLWLTIQGHSPLLQMSQNSTQNTRHIHILFAHPQTRAGRNEAMRSCLYSAQFLHAILSVITFLTCECCHPPQAGFPMSTNAIKQSPLNVPRGPLSGHSKLCKVERTHHHNIHLQKKKKREKTLRSVSLMRCFGWLSRMN